MAESQVDEVILSVVGTRWVKVAIVIAKTADVVRVDPSADDDTYAMIFRHIEVLVHKGKLVAQGNIKNWRFSEICRPSGLKNLN
jgi:hypothetical protein